MVLGRSFGARRWYARSSVIRQEDQAGMVLLGSVYSHLRRPQTTPVGITTDLLDAPGSVVATVSHGELRDLETFLAQLSIVGIDTRWSPLRQVRPDSGAEGDLRGDRARDTSRRGAPDARGANPLDRVITSASAQLDPSAPDLPEIADQLGRQAAVHTPTRDALQLGEELRRVYERLTGSRPSF